MSGHKCLNSHEFSYEEGHSKMIDCCIDALFNVLTGMIVINHVLAGACARE